jgi:hypothetical protein
LEKTREWENDFVPSIGGGCKYCGKCPGEAEAGRTAGDGQEKEDVKLRLKWPSTLPSVCYRRRIRRRDISREANKSQGEADHQLEEATTPVASEVFEVFVG